MILHHICTSCGHPDYFHAANDCSYAHCPCSQAKRHFDPDPVHGPTWDEALQPVLTVTAPGTRWPERGQGHITCSCERCHDEYARLTA